MDSLTQIVLGAAVGEFCQGRKLGNRAMIWGAFAGTIPDLDVISGLWLDDLGSLEAHRGISHSLFFATLFPFLIAFYTSWFYDSDIFKSKKFKRLAFGAASLFLVACLIVPIFITRIFSISDSYFVGLVMVLLSVIFIYRWYTNYLKTAQYNFEKLSYREWYIFFFWTIITHPILDCFTVYGTQLFRPFSIKRISWDNISVVDPAYTIPFLICLIIASFYPRLSKSRKVWNTLGIVLSTAYMALTFVHKNKVNKVVERSIAQENIEPIRYMNNPTIFNNYLWTAAVETDSMFYTGRYSLFDSKDYFKLYGHKKNVGFSEENKNNYAFNVLSWFSNDYYWVRQDSIDTYTYFDLRYGLTDDQGNLDSGVFVMKLQKNKSDILHLVEGSQAESRENFDFKVKILEMIKRIRGI